MERFLEEIERRGRDHLVMGVMDPRNDGFQMLTLKQGTSLDRWGPIAGSEAWILEEQVLRPILGDSLVQCVNCVLTYAIRESLVLVVVQGCVVEEARREPDGVR